MPVKSIFACRKRCACDDRLAVFKENRSMLIYGVKMYRPINYNKMSEILVCLCMYTLSTLCKGLLTNSWSDDTNRLFNSQFHIKPFLNFPKYSMSYRLEVHWVIILFYTQIYKTFCILQTSCILVCSFVHSSMLYVKNFYLDRCLLQRPNYEQTNLSHRASF
jgi:hypothetical protein